MTTPTGSEPFLVDSPGWVEYFGGGPKSSDFMPYLADEHNLLVPTVVLYEVFKRLLREQGKTIADVFLSRALPNIAVSFTEDLALDAAQLSITHKLAMADAIIYATALLRGAKLVTSDRHFHGLTDAIVF